MEKMKKYDENMIGGKSKSNMIISIVRNVIKFVENEVKIYLILKRYISGYKIRKNATFINKVVI